MHSNGNSFGSGKTTEREAPLYRWLLSPGSAATRPGGQCCCWCGAVHPAGWRHASGAAAAYPPPRDQGGQEVLTTPEDTEPLCPGCEG